jgi:hypothetical protein
MRKGVAMIEVEIASSDETKEVVRDPTPVEVAALIDGRAHDSDTTISIVDSRHEDRQLLISFGGRKALVGLVSDDQQQYQLLRQGAEIGDVAMIIGGQPTIIQGRFAVEPAHAARAATAFMEGDPLGDSSLKWELC